MVMSFRYFFKLDVFNFPSRTRYISRDNLIHFQRASWNLSIAPSISLEAQDSSELSGYLGSARAALRLHWFQLPTMIACLPVHHTGKEVASSL